MPKIRVLIVDDAVVFRKLLTSCIDGDKDIEVVGTAANGHQALVKLEETQPDVVTLDIEMPEMDGLQALDEIRKKHPKLPVIMFSTLTDRGAMATLDALSRGASDYVTKPANIGSVTASIHRVRDELIPKIKSLCVRSAGAPAPVARADAFVRKVREPRSQAGRAEIVAIGVSTGGPNALAALLPGFARHLGVPVVIVQHMPALFTRLLAERLAAASGVAAHEAANGDLLRPGEIWVAPGGQHMELERTADGVRIRTHDGPPENSCRPSVDVLFRSVAQVYGPRALGLVLTGMGTDGLRGCDRIRELGGQVLVQDEASSVVWGMPGAVFQAGLADKVLPLSELAAEVSRRVQLEPVHL